MGDKRDLWQRAFLMALADSGVLSHAAAAAGVDRTTIWRYRQSDPAFDAAVQDAMEQATDKLVQEARRRALEGVEEPVYQGGVLVGTKRVYSDYLMGKMLAAYRPGQFGTQRTELTGAGGGPVKVADETQAAARLAQLLAVARSRKDASQAEDDDFV